jgi:rod shape-determining protein MreC
VVTSGLGGVFPKGLEIGTLLEVRRDEKGVAYEGEVLPSVDYKSLEEVFVRSEE